MRVSGMRHGLSKKDFYSVDDNHDDDKKLRRLGLQLQKAYIQSRAIMFKEDKGT